MEISLVWCKHRETYNVFKYPYSSYWPLYVGVETM